jgi:hypothetical protein
MSIHLSLWSCWDKIQGGLGWLIKPLSSYELRGLIQTFYSCFKVTTVKNKLAEKNSSSLYDIKANYSNQNYIITNLDRNAIKMHPNYEKLLNLGKIN